MTGIEPARPKALVPKTSASTNSATYAFEESARFELADQLRPPR